MGLSYEKPRKNLPGAVSQLKRICRRRAFCGPRNRNSRNGPGEELLQPLQPHPAGKTASGVAPWLPIPAANPRRAPRRERMC